MHNYARRRRLSHRAIPNLFQTLALPEGDTVDAGDRFPDEDLEVTFAGKVRRETTAAQSFLLAGAQLELGTVASGGLTLRVGTFSANTTKAIEVGRVFRFALSVRPNDSQVRLWIDSERFLAAQFGSIVLPWHDAGVLSFVNTASATMLEDLDVFYTHRPRHFGDANLILSDAVSDILFRSTRATFQVGSWPYMENPNL